MRVQWDTTAVFVAGDSKFKTLAELVDWGKKNPRQLKFAGTSPGGWSEIQTVAFFKKQGVDVTFVPFDGGAEIKAAILRAEQTSTMWWGWYRCFASRSPGTPRSLSRLIKGYRSLRRRAVSWLNLS
jgi:hypothetical protein